MSNELKDCPFCGSKPTMKHIGNDHTKARAVEVKCSNVECRVARTDKAFRHDHAWLTAVATKNWNRRPALAASGGNAAPELTDEQISKAVEDAKVKCVHPEAATTIDIGRAVLKAAASAPNAALVAASNQALQYLSAVAKKTGSNHVWERCESICSDLRAALSAAGQEVGQ